MAELVFARLSEPSHRLPMFDKGGEPFPKEGRRVDAHHPFYRQLIADGSLVVDEPKATVPAALGAIGPAANSSKGS